MDTWEVLSILSSFLLVGLNSGPWLALSPSVRTFHPKLLIGIVEHMSRTMTPALTVLMPTAILAMIPLLIESHGVNSIVFGFNVSSFVLSIIWQIVAILFELPTVNAIAAWTTSSIPENWRHQRDYWLAVHKIRVFTGIAGLLSLILGALARRVT